MDTCGGRQTTPGPSFVHYMMMYRIRGWNADASKSLQSSADRGGGISSPCPAWEAVASDKSNTCMQPNIDAGIEIPEIKSHPNIPQKEQPARRSLRIRSPSQRLIEAK